MKTTAVLEHFAHHNVKTSIQNMINYVNYDQLIFTKRGMPTNALLKKLRIGTDAWLKIQTGMTGYELPSLISEIKLYGKTAFKNNLIHFYNGDGNCKFTPKRKGRNMVLSTYHQPPDFFYDFFKKCEHLEMLDGALITSNVMRDMFHKYLPDDRIFYQPLAVDIDFFKPEPDRKPNDGKKRCVLIGNWLRDFEMMAEVTKILKSRKDIEFNIITLDYNRHYFEGLENVNFYSGIPLDIYMEKLHAADLLVLPLKSGTSNLAVLESMACGIPIVTTDVEGIKDYADKSFTAFVKKGDHKAMADTIVGLLGDDKKRSEMSKNAREHSLNFSWEKISEKLKKIYVHFGASPS